MNQNLSPEQALQILAQAASLAPLPDSGHEMWKKAVQVLLKALPAKQDKEEV